MAPNGKNSAAADHAYLTWPDDRKWEFHRGVIPFFAGAAMLPESAIRTALSRDLELHTTITRMLDALLTVCDLNRDGGFSNVPPPGTAGPRDLAN